MRRGTTRSLVSGLAVLVVILVVWLGGGLGGGDRGDAPATTSHRSQQDTDAGARHDDRPGTIAYDALPPEARQTIGLIDRGGPYPYPQDDGVFGNREGILPDAPRGTYREYTVETPGSDDRGARRLVRARDGTLYYTDDHYQSFRRVER